MHFDYKWNVVLILTAVWFVVLYIIGRKIYRSENFLKMNEKKILTGFFLLLFFTQMFFFFQMASYPTRDLENVFRSAFYYAIQGEVDPLNIDYLYKYPNNVTWVVVFQFLFRIARKFGADAYMTYIIIASVVNGLAIATAYLFTYLSAKKLMGVAAGFFSMVMLYTCLPLQFNISFFYTDTLTMMFIPLVFYFYLWFKDNTVRKMWLPLIIFGLVTAFGIHMKYTVVIVLIAVAIDMVLKMDFRKLVAIAVSVGVGYMLWYCIIFGFTYSNILDKELSQQSRTPFSSYIMMGLNGDGAFNEQDRVYAWSFETQQEKKENINRQIILRLKEHTVVTFLQHLNQKGVRSFGSGNMEYNYTISNSPVKQTFLVDCVSPGTEEFVVMGHVVQGWHVMLFLLVIASAVISMVKKNYAVFVPLLAILGLYLFLLISEASQRYLTNYMCAYVLCAGWRMHFLSGVRFSNEKIKERIS